MKHPFFRWRKASGDHDCYIALDEVSMVAHDDTDYEEGRYALITLRGGYRINIPGEDRERFMRAWRAYVSNK